MPSVIVIGGGAIGAALTYRLVEEGARVTLVDAGEPGGGTTSATFAMSIPTRKTPRAHHDLAVAGMSEHRRLARDLGGVGDTSWVHAAPAYEWGSTPHERALIEARMARLQAWGYPAEWISGTDLERFEPAVPPPPAAARVARYPREHWYDPDLMTGLLIDAAKARGAKVCPQTRVEQIDDRSTGVRVRAGDRTFHADRVVLCAGPNASEVARSAGLELAVHRVPGLIVRSAPVPADTLRGIVMGTQVNIRPAPDGGLLAHSYTTDADLPETVDDPASSTWARQVIEHASAMVPAFAAVDVVSARVGIRPVPADGLPIVGWLAPARIYVVATHSGINLAPVLGRLAAPEILGASDREMLADFRPGRASLQQEDSLDESTREMGRILHEKA